MSGDQLGQLSYLVLLAGALLFWYITANRNSLGKTLQYAVLWGLIFLGVIAAVGLWDDIKQTVAPGQTMIVQDGQIALPRAPDGHYYVTLEINDTPVRFVVDTGATAVVLTQADAARAGLDPENLAFFSQAMTANGLVRTAPVRLEDVQLGPFADRDIPAFVNEGDMPQSLLGMTYLQRFDRLEISNGQMILER